MKLLRNYPFTHFEVNNPNGDVTMCCNHHKVLGNVNEQSIEEIWNGKKYQEVRKIFLDGKIFDICSKNCPVLKGWKDYEKMDWYKQLPQNSEVYKNSVLNEKEILKEKIVLKSKPRWIRFAASYRCNLRCYHCFQAEERNEISILPQKFFNELKKDYLKILQVIFFYGGEPLIEKKNLELMKFIGDKYNHVRLVIATNGTILNEEIKKMFSELNIMRFHIFLDSIDEKLYKELRCPADFSTVLKNIEYFSKIIKKNDADLIISMTLNKKNINEIFNFIKLTLIFKGIPIFQIANNTFKNKSFRKKYEINDKLNLTKLLQTMKMILSNNELNLNKHSIHNIKSIIQYCNDKLKDKNFLFRIKKSLNRLKKKILKQLQNKVLLYTEKQKNRLKYHKELHKTSVISYTPPVFAATITDNCNLRCPSCLYILENNHEFSNKYISINDFHKILQKYQNNKLGDVIFLTGGEPLLHPELEKIIKICIDYKLQPKISTNGILIKSNINKLKKLKYVNVSIDAWDENSFKIYRGGSKKQFDLLIEGLNLLKKNKIYFSMSFLLTLDNISNFNKMLELAKKIKPDFIYFHNINPHGCSDFKVLTLENKKVLKFLKK